MIVPTLYALFLISGPKYEDITTSTVVRDLSLDDCNFAAREIVQNKKLNVLHIQCIPQSVRSGTERIQ